MWPVKDDCDVVTLLLENMFFHFQVVSGDGWKERERFDRLAYTFMLHVASVTRLREFLNFLKINFLTKVALIL